jgi:amino acid transporter
MVKVILFLILVPLCLALIGGAGPKGFVHHGETWVSLPAFKNGIKVSLSEPGHYYYSLTEIDQGFANCALLAIWAIGDQVFIGVMGGEAENPRWSLARSADMVPTRLGFIYVLSVIFIGLLVPSDEDRLLSGSGVAASPFVIAVTDSGIPGLPSVINACMVIGVLAIALECIYLPSRILRNMAQQGFVPAFIANVDERGRPRWALGITAAFGLIFTYIGLSSE